MTNEEKDEFLKEIRLVVLHDVEMALAKLSPAQPVSGKEISRGVADDIRRSINERMDEVSNGTADRVRFR